MHQSKERRETCATTSMFVILFVVHELLISMVKLTFSASERAELSASLPFGPVMVLKVHRDGASMPPNNCEQAVLVSFLTTTNDKDFTSKSPTDTDTSF